MFGRNAFKPLRFAKLFPNPLQRARVHPCLMATTAPSGAERPDFLRTDRLHSIGARFSPRRLRVQRVAIIGATGYIGGRLAPRLLDAGYAVRCLARSPRKLEGRDWTSQSHVEIWKTDL